MTTRESRRIYDGRASSSAKQVSICFWGVRIIARTSLQLVETKMVALVNRRALVGSILSSTLCSSSVLVEDVAKFIATSTPRAFREAVAQAQGTFLYRGQQQPTSTNSPIIMAGHVCSPLPDLLFQETYDSKEALEYFQCLEEYLALQNIVAKPSTGHIGTSSKKNAQEWGNVVSIWPLGTQLSFVYPKRKTRIRFFFYCWYLFELSRGGIWHQYQSRNGTTRGTRSLVCVVVWLQSLYCSSDVVLCSSAAKIRQETKETAGIRKLWIEQLDTLPDTRCDTAVELSSSTFLVNLVGSIKTGQRRNYEFG